MIHCRSSPAPGLQRTVLALATHWPFLEKPRIYATSSLISFGFSFSSNFGIFFLPLVTIWTRLASLSVSVSRSEEHTSELQSRLHLVCRLLLEKKKKILCPSSPTS